MAARAAPMVARWEADCIRWQLPWQDLEHIYIVSADGGAPKEVTKGERDERFPNWSRDGNSLFFGNLPADIGPASAIYRLNLKTNQLTTLTGSEGKWFPRLSPDDNYIAALSNTNHLMLFDVKAQKWTELTQTTATTQHGRMMENMCTSTPRPKVSRRSIACKSKITNWNA